MPRAIELALEDVGQRGAPMSVTLLSRALATLQKALYQTGESLSGADQVRRRGRFPQQVTDECELYVSHIHGSHIAATLTLAEPSQGVLFADDSRLGEAALDRLVLLGMAATNGAITQAHQIIPDAFYRNRILATLESLCPKPEESVRIRVSEVDGEGRSFTLDQDSVARMSPLRIEREMDVRTVMGKIIELRIVEGRYFKVLRSGREIKCFYEPDVEDTVIEHIGCTVAVQGEVVLDEHGQIERMESVSAVAPLDLSPFRLEAVRLGDRTLSLAEPREVPVRIEDDVLLAELDELQLLSYGGSRDELYGSLLDDLFMLWDEYAQAPDPELTADGQALKQAVQAFLREGD